MGAIAGRRPGLGRVEPATQQADERTAPTGAGRWTSTHSALTSLSPKDSKYLAKDDVGEEGQNLTIRGFKTEAVKGDHGEEPKVILYFVEEGYKPMILNQTNSKRIGIATGAKSAGEARGKKINVYCDPMIEFAGEIVGGLRIRKATDVPPAPKQEADPFDDSVPF